MYHFNILIAYFYIGPREIQGTAPDGASRGKDPKAPDI